VPSECVKAVTLSILTDPSTTICVQGTTPLPKLQIHKRTVGKSGPMARAVPQVLGIRPPLPFSPGAEPGTHTGRRLRVVSLGAPLTYVSISQFLAGRSGARKTRQGPSGVELGITGQGYKKSSARTAQPQIAKDKAMKCAYFCNAGQKAGVAEPPNLATDNTTQALQSGLSLRRRLGCVCRRPH